MSEGSLAGQQCFVCGVERLPHQMSEQRGEISHKFSLDARVERSTLRAGQTSERPRPTVMITVVPAPDLALRRLLIDKGLIDESELPDVAPTLSAEDLGLS